MHELRVGFGAHDITPAAGTAMSGFAARTEPAAGAHDRLQARAVAFADGARTLLAIVLDVIGVDSRLTARVRDGVLATASPAPDDVVVAATHTHGGPAVLEGAFLGAADAAVVEQVATGAVVAGLRALDDLAPARLAYAEGHEATYARNRRVPGGVIDPRVPVLHARREGRRDVALVGYACHPVVLGPDNILFTRDYPGYLVDALEESLPGTDAVFLCGCCGQVNTGHSAQASLEVRSAPQRTYEAARRVGRAVAEAAAQALAAGASPLRGSSVRAVRAEVALPFDAPTTDPREDARRWREELEGDPPPTPARRGWLEGCLAWAERHPEPRSGALTVPVACWAVGELRFLWFPGEAFVEQGLEAAEAYAGPLFTVANANAAPGYVPHPSAFPAGGYEVAEAFRFYGTPGPLSPEASVRLGQAARVLLARLGPPEP